MRHTKKALLLASALSVVGGSQMLFASSSDNNGWNYGTLDNPVYTAISNVNLDNRWNYGALDSPIYAAVAQIPSFIWNWNYGTLDMPVWFSFGSQSSNSNDTNFYADTIQNTPPQQVISYDILDNAVTGISSIGSDSNLNSGWNYGTIQNPVYSFASQLSAFVGSWNYGTLDMPVWFSFESQSSNSKQNTSTQSEVVQSKVTTSPNTQKCPVKSTDLGTPIGTGSGLVSTTGSHVKLEYALYDTCGASIQGTRENRLAFDAVVGEGTIPGFAQAMIGMQAGQTREFTLSPKDAYGEEFVDISITHEMLQGIIVRPVDSEIYTNNEPITESLGAPVDTTKIQVGSVYPSSVDPNIFMKVTAIDGDKVTYVLDTSRLPFYNKPIAPGTKASKDGVDYEIVSVSGSTMMVSQKMPDAAIFSESEIKNGAKQRLSEKSLALFGRLGLKAGDEVEIIDAPFNSDEVILRIPNKQELAGKSLVFSIKIMSVSK